MVIDNGTQFIDQKFQSFLTSYKVKHNSTSVEHPEATNKVVLRGLKKRLNEAKGSWTDAVVILDDTSVNYGQNSWQANLQGRSHDSSRSQRA